jgi:hypothetical protein
MSAAKCVLDRLVNPPRPGSGNTTAISDYTNHRSQQWQNAALAMATGSGSIAPEFSPENWDAWANS